MQPGNPNSLTDLDKAWAAKQIATILSTAEEDAPPLVDFLAGIDDPNELQGQILDLLGETAPALEFATELLAKRFAPPPSPPSLPPPIPPRQQPNIEETVPPPKSQRQLKRERQQREKEEKEETERQRRAANRKRIKCECQASEHELLTNCLSCGRIVCELEGPGPCMFCGSDVQNPDQQLQQHMQRLLKRSGKDEQKEAWSNATKRKERLLTFDRTAAQRTRLIDQASDFDVGAVGKWMSPEERAAAEEQRAKHAQAVADRETRMRNGMRVLRINMGTGTAELQRMDEEEEEEEEEVVGTPSLPPRTVQKAVAKQGGAFAHNPLLKDVAEPKFVLALGDGRTVKKKLGATASKEEKTARQRQMLRIQNDDDL